MYLCYVIKQMAMATRQSGLILGTMDLFTVFYLVGGSSNFVCRSILGKFNWEDAKKEVAKIQKMGYKAMAIKNGHIIGGYCSYTDFESPQDAKNYYSSL